MAIDSAVPRAPYACDPAHSRGRLRAEPASKSRNAFRRDCDRIIHSTAFRRLKHKTQVFVFDEGDHYRTRLTHTLEVTQVARALARALGLDEDLAEALALAHDLGHPPFGHAGERALDACLAAFGGFDHNAQTLRVVTALERRYPQFDGLNLTWETLEGLVKHNGPLTDREGHPLGRYRSHGVPATILDYVAAPGPAIMEFSGPRSADRRVGRRHRLRRPRHRRWDCALNCSGSTTSPRCALPATIIAEIRAAYPGLDPPRLVHEFIRRLIGAADRRRYRRDRAAACRAGAALGRRGAAGAGGGRGVLGGNREEPIGPSRPFSNTHMYRHARVHARHGRGGGCRSATCSRAIAPSPDDLPAEWREGLAGADEAARARRIADFIAGMTDRYALAEHHAAF